jgi:hypothetical protein
VKQTLVITLTALLLAPLAALHAAEAHGNPAFKTPNPHRPRAFGGKGAEGMKKEIPSSRLLIC